MADVIRYTDPCAYCGRPLRDVASQGCGSREFPPDQVNRLCEVLSRARRGGRP